MSNDNLTAQEKIEQAAAQRKLEIDKALETMELPEDTNEYDEELETDDAGAKARDKMAVKHRKSKWHIYLIWLTALLVIVAGACWAVYNDSSTVINKRVVDIRECKVNFDDVEVKGRRYYTKHYTEVLGIRFMQKKDIEETTEIHHDYTETVVVGMTKGEWWRLHLTKGEPARRVLAPTEHYVFVQEGNAVVIDYEAFCK